MPGPSYSTYRNGLHLAAGPSNPYPNSNGSAPARDLSHDIYIPASYEERQRRGIESQLARANRLRASNPHQTAASSSTVDTYDRIGRDGGDDDNDDGDNDNDAADDHRFFSARRQTDYDESLIPGVGRGLRAQHPSSAQSPSYRHSIYHFDSRQMQTKPQMYPAASAKSPYRSRIAAHAQHTSSPGSRPRPARVDTATDSADDSISSATSSSGSDGFESTGNHRAFAATPAGGTLTSRSTNAGAQHRFARPTLGEDTLDRIDFDRYTDSDRASRASRKKLNEDDPTYTNAYPSSEAARSDVVKPASQNSQTHLAGRPGPSQDPHDPFHSSRNWASSPPAPSNDLDRTRPMMSNAAAYQQHLNSRTLTSPAIRTLVGDRTKSPDSPSPAPSISGRIFNRERGPLADRAAAQAPNPIARGKVGALARAGLERESSLTALSAFEDMARKLQRDVELTRRAEEIDEARRTDDDAATLNNSNSGGSGYGPGSQVSSARTRVEHRDLEPATGPGQEGDLKGQGGSVATTTKFNANGYPAFGELRGPSPDQHKTIAAYPAHLRPGAPGHLYPGSATRKARLDDPFAARLPDVTGLTSMLASPLKARDGVSHIPIDPAVGSQFARLEELGHLRVFVDSLQTELERAGDRIVNLEESQEMQKEEVDGLRREVQSVWQDVREVRGGEFLKTLLDRIREEERHIYRQQQQQQQQQQQDIPNAQQMAPGPTTMQPQQSAAEQHQVGGPADETSHTHVDAPDVAEMPRNRSPARKDSAADHDGARTMSQSEHDEVIQRLYGELDKLKAAMAEQFRKATQLATDDKVAASGAQQAAAVTAAAVPASHVDAGTADRPQARRSFDGHGTTRQDQRDPWDAIEALRVQVVYLAGEVEKLNDVVVEELVEPRRAAKHHSYAASNIRKTSPMRATTRAPYGINDDGLEMDPEAVHSHPYLKRATDRFHEGGHPASDPAPFETAARMDRADGRQRASSPPLPRHPTTRLGPSQLQQRSRVSFGHEEAVSRHRGPMGRDYDPDETIDAVAENRRRLSQTLLREQATGADDGNGVYGGDEEDISTIAEARAQRAFESMARHTARLHPHDSDGRLGAASQHHLLEHDTRHCTVCSNSRKSARRQQSRRSKALERERQREADEIEEETLLQAFEDVGDDGDAATAVGATIEVTSSQLKTLQRMLQEHWDEFVHQRMLYSELADELKHLSPRMSKEKRRILAQHVLEAVEMLELKADRINRLERLIESLLVDDDADRAGRQASSPSAPMSRAKRAAGSKTTRDEQPNGLRHALDRMSASSPPPVLAGQKTRLTPKAQQKAMERLSASSYQQQQQQQQQQQRHGRNSPPTIDH